MASVEKLPSGRWRGVYRDSGGKKKHTKAPHYERKRDAQREANRMEIEARKVSASRSGSLPPQTRYEEWARMWNERRVLDPDSWYIEHRLLEGKVIPAWGEVPLNRINRHDIQEWIDGLSTKRGFSPAYVRRIWSTFKGSMSAAVEHDILASSPCSGVKLPKKTKGRRKAIEMDDLHKVFAVLHPVYRAAVVLMAECGFRPSELFGLHRSDVNLDEGWVTIWQVYSGMQKRIKKYTKDHEVRVVPLSKRATDEFRTLWSLQPSRSRCGLDHVDGRSCVSDLAIRLVNGNPMNPQALRVALAYGCKKVGLVLTPYELRHTYGTRLAAAGVDPWQIATLMGHSDINQTATYVHQTSGARERVVAALDATAARPRLTIVDSA